MSTTKKRLPFKTAPQIELFEIGNPKIGTLDIPIYYDLTPSERLFAEEALKDTPNIQETMVKIASEIAEKNGVGLLEIYNKLNTGAVDLLEKHLPQFIEIQKMQRDVSQIERNVYATAILKYRIEPDWQLEDTGNPELILPLLVEELYDFAKKELNGWNTPPAVTEEDLKKFSGEKADNLSTGEQSSGDLEDSGQKTIDLPPTTSETVPATSSSKHSKKEPVSS